MDGGDDDVCTICPCPLWIARVRSCVKHENSEMPQCDGLRLRLILPETRLCLSLMFNDLLLGLFFFFSFIYGAS